MLKFMDYQKCRSCTKRYSFNTAFSYDGLNLHLLPIRCNICCKQNHCVNLCNFFLNCMFTEYKHFIFFLFYEKHNDFCMWEVFLWSMITWHSHLVEIQFNSTYKKKSDYRKCRWSNRLLVKYKTKYFTLIETLHFTRLLVIFKYRLNLQPLY